ncbi:hypothetical protein NM688_g8475 [Phlebia brevispora]|uniref:Uncharacterized protein n=1 Tax=Phlebia brevispora TaxID=194682 RepID=A0ACC1RR05_9APHY|nr:hypothetical protein NM688_g8475 [Phlebia brevispora]
MITCGDDCLAIKGNSTNILARNITCRGGNGIAVGSLGQYVDLVRITDFPIALDIVDNVLFEDVKLVRLDSQIQPNMATGIVVFRAFRYISRHGQAPSTGYLRSEAGEGGGRVSNVVSRGFSHDRVSLPIHLYQTNDGQSTDAPSHLQFSNLTFENFSGTSLGSEIVDIECSPAVPCPNIEFSNIDVQAPTGEEPEFVCVNVVNESGLPGPCTSTV